MANDSKSKTAKERFAKAKKDAEDAELAAGPANKTSDADDAGKDQDTLTGGGVAPDTSTKADDDTLAADDALSGDTVSGDTVSGDTISGDTISGGDGDDTLAGGVSTDRPDPIADTTTPDEPAEDLIVPAEPAPGAASGQNDMHEQDDIAADDHADDGQTEDGPGFAATALKYLVILLIGMGVALWAAPRLAPHLPAPVAAWVAPASSLNAETEERLAAMIAEQTAAATEAAEARANAAEEQVAALSAQMDENLAALRSELSAEIGAAAQTRGAAADRVEDVAERITAAEAALEGVRTEIANLSGFSGDGEAPNAETLERVAAFGAAVQGLRSEVAALSERASEIEAAAQAADVEALAARVTALEGGEAATANARSEAEEIVRAANIDAALTRLSHSLSAGSAYEGPLDELARLAGAEAPESLAATAAAGVPTVASLTRSFPAAAQAAYAADLKANAGDGVFDSVFASVQGRVGGRPSVETSGDDTGAILSRMEARLSEGELAAVQGEAQDLSEAAQSAMSSWLSRLDQTVAARSGLADLRNTLNSK